MNLAELPGKIIAVIETALIGNLGDGHIGIVQQIFRFLNPVLQEITPRRGMIGVLEEAVKMSDGQAGLFG